MTLVFTFSRASVFSVRTSSLVHGRSLVVFFAIARSYLDPNLLLLTPSYHEQRG